MAEGKKIKMTRTVADKFAPKLTELTYIPPPSKEMGVVHEDGSITDAEIHEAILDNPDAELAQARRRSVYIEKGLS